MKIKITDDRNLAGYGLIKTGDVRDDLPDELAAQLIQQNFAVVLADEKPKSAPRSGKED